MALGASFAAIAGHPSALVMLLTALMLVLTAEMIVIAYAAWMEQVFGATVQTLGSIAATFAVADIVGEVLSMWGVDRFGKKRALLVGFIGTTALYFVIPLLGASFLLALAALFLYYVCFEFTVVSIFPLISELAPEARGTIISLAILAENVGRMAGAVGGAWLFGAAGFGANGIAAGLILAVTTVVFWRGVQEGG